MEDFLYGLSLGIALGVVTAVIIHNCKISTHELIKPEIKISIKKDIIDTTYIYKYE